MGKVEQTIKDAIRQSGPITFEQFMNMALYYPSLGYYTSGRQRLGAEGDYYTAPYASSVMSMLIAKQIAQFFELLGKPTPFYVVEVGGGTGKMADDIIESSFRWHNDFYNALRYVIIEKHPLSGIEHKDKIEIHETLHKVKPFTGCIVSNELFDALPVHVVAMKDRLYEVYVTLEDDHFAELLMPASEELVRHFDFIGVKPVEGMWTEVNLQARDMLKTMSDVLRHGYILTIDYGYTAPEYYASHRSNGTLVCYHNHKIDDNPYEFVGEKDITSHIDFTSLAKWGREFSLNTLGYVRQRDFVMSMGYNDLLAKIKDIVSDPVDYYRLTSASKFLIMPDAMGDIFKVLLQYKGDLQLPLPIGFTYKNNII
jgi:SAM-dependent MidA family methyltransferase